MPNLVKIGKTTRSSLDRAREVSSATGVPTPFILAFELFSENCDELERKAHGHFGNMRVSPGREFFTAPLKDVINFLLENNRQASGPDSVFVAEDILSSLRMRFGDQLDPTIVGARIVQSSDTVWLETTREAIVAGYLRDVTIRRTDLAFISSSDAPIFTTSSTVAANIAMFMALDDISIINCTDLLHESACIAISQRHSEERENGGRDSLALGAS
jgi:hypothetical protein